LPAVAEKQLGQRIKNLQRVYLGLTRNYNRMISDQICKEHRIHGIAEWWGKSDLLAFSEEMQA
jgi:hypothetical protein